MRSSTSASTYRAGVSDGLYHLAQQEKKEEKQKAIETEKRRLEAARAAEEEEDKRRVQRLEQPPSDGNINASAAAPSGDGLRPPKQEVDDRRNVRVKVEVVDDEGDFPRFPRGQSFACIPILGVVTVQSYRVLTDTTLTLTPS